MKTLNIIFLSLLLISVKLSAQEGKYLRKAAKATEKAEFEKAIEYYNKVLAQNSNSLVANTGIGFILSEYLERYGEAIPFLEKALKQTDPDTLFNVYFSLAKSYHYLGDYTTALSYYNKLVDLEEVGNPMFTLSLNKRIADCHYGLEHQEIVQKHYIENIGETINTKEPEYVPIITSNKELIFTSKRKDDPKEKINPWDGKYFESMYISKIENGNYSIPRRFTEPDKMDDSKFSKFNESNVSLALNDRLLFIYKDGDLYQAFLNNSSVKSKKLNKNVNFARYQNHATVTKDNKTLYFSSEAKQGIGGTDIYMSVKNENGEWSPATILDSTINTVFNEDSPYISEDGTLYFSSMGHPGYGGYDIYKSHIENGKWTKPENLGQPINSPGEDIYFSLTDNTHGLFSSSRPYGFGDMDIYTVDMDKIEKEPIPEPLAQNLNNSPSQTKDSVISTMFLAESELTKLGWDPSPLYFNYNDSKLRADALIILKNNLKVLKHNRKLEFVINGFSDSRGPEKYNKYLSENRANFVKEYLVKKGINPSRIKTIEGYGETGLLNNCIDGVACTEDEHQKNRRVEIKVFNPDYKATTPIVKGSK